MAPFLGWDCGGAPARGVMARPVSPKPSIRRLCCAHRRTLRSSACDVCRSTFPAVLSCTRHARLCTAVDIERRPLSLWKLIMLIRRLRRVPPRGRWVCGFGPPGRCGPWSRCCLMASALRTDERSPIRAPCAQLEPAPPKTRALCSCILPSGQTLKGIRGGHAAHAANHVNAANHVCAAHIAAKFLGHEDSPLLHC